MAEKKNTGSSMESVYVAPPKEEPAIQEPEKKEGYIKTLIALMKKEGKNYTTRDDVLHWAAEVDNDEKNPLKGDVASVFSRLTAPDMETWKNHQKKLNGDDSDPSLVPAAAPDKNDKNKQANNIDEEDLYKWSKKKV
jgi:hypothetical protein